MSEKTFIQSKDAALEDSINHILTALKNRGIEIDIVETQNPAPNVYWTHIRSQVAPTCFTNGKGACEKASIASALGEFVERLATNYLFADFYLGQDLANTNDEFGFVHYPDEKWFAEAGEVLTPDLRKFYGADLVSFSDINSYTTQNESHFCALPFIAQKTDKPVYFPVNLVANLYVSNGMSAGNSKTEARTQGLSEIFERYVKNRILSEGIALPTIPNANIPEHIHAPIDALRALGHIVHVFDASLGGRYPVISVSLINRENGGCLTAFGAHPNFHVAIERTVTELLQGRQIHQLNEFFAPVWDLSLVEDPHNLETHFIDSTGLVSWELYRSNPDYDFNAWNFAGDSQSEYQFLLDLVHEHQTDAYIADYPHLGMYACRIIVPSLSEIYPVEELCENNNNIGNSLREEILSIPSYRDANTLRRILDKIDALGLDDSELVRQVFGLSVEPNNPWSTMRLGEVRALINLAIDELNDALDDCVWLLTFGGLPEERRRFYQAVVDIINSFKTNDAALYSDILSQVHGEFYERALAHCTGDITQRTKFYNILPLTANLAELTQHQNMLALYKLGQRAKS